MMPILRCLLPATAALFLLACAGAPSKRESRVDDFLISPICVTTFKGNTDDLLTAGLGLGGLRAMTPPAFAVADAPTPEEVRRRAIWNSWRGIADLAPGGGYTDLYGALPLIEGREFQALAKVPGAKAPHRVLLQLPDDFDKQKRCVLVAASSGSRGIYGAIAVAGAWGLPRGCAVAYTDKGAGTGYFDSDSDTGVRVDGTRGARGDRLEFEPPRASAEHTVAIKHLHSQDNPESQWGLHVMQAAEFALRALNEGLPDEKHFDFSNTRVIALGLSNGAGAVLRAAEIDGGKLAGVVAVAPNVFSGGKGARSLYDYTSEAALYQPCALLHSAFDSVALARPAGAKPPAWIARCAALKEHGLLGGADVAAQAGEAYARLRASGWTDAALASGALSVSFDLWRVVGAGYASAFGRYGADEMPCGYRYAPLGADRKPRPSTPVERAAWGADGSGIPPTPSIGLVDTLATGADPALPGLLCLRNLWDGKSADALRVQRGIAETRATLPRKDLPIVLIHGMDDGLIPAAFSGGAYAQWAQAAGRDVRYWQVHNAQHFDAFLGLPTMAARYLPLLPYTYRAMDAMWAHVAQGAALPPSVEIATTARGMEGAVPKPLAKSHLGTMPGD
jgi:hydroxybutyrate-dimer hydrolase